METSVLGETFWLLNHKQLLAKFSQHNVKQNETKWKCVKQNKSVIIKVEKLYNEVYYELSFKKWIMEHNMNELIIIAKILTKNCYKEHSLNKIQPTN